METCHRYLSVVVRGHPKDGESQHVIGNLVKCQAVYQSPVSQMDLCITAACPFASSQLHWTQNIMPPRLRLRSDLLTVFKIRTSCHASRPIVGQPSQRRWVNSKEEQSSTTNQPKGPNQEQLPHVSEEAAAVSKAMGEDGPEIQQGTPVHDVS